MRLSRYRYRGRHRAPSTTGRTAARVAVAGASLAVPLGLAQPAHAAPPGGWDAIIHCESRGDPRAQNPRSTASGLFQFLDSTWRSLGGSGSASDHSAAEQYRMAEKLYARAGTAPWNASKACWGPRLAAGTGRHASGQPAPKHAKSEPARHAATPASSDGGYVVQPGDTLSGIAARHGLAWPRLFELNRDVVEDPDMIFPGESLRLP